MTGVVDLFGIPTAQRQSIDWQQVVSDQHCPFVDRKCYKVRKSQPEISIGTCTVEYSNGPVVICPNRLLAGNKIFIDCLHLLTAHEPGNELHIVSEVGVPGGSVDYVLASVKGKKICDFVGIELQTLDTTGTVWPARQRFLLEMGIEEIDTSYAENSKKYGMNWKMTAKTILVQLHHKLNTFETLGKHMVLVVQDRLMNYMTGEFRFDHLASASLSDPMHFHSYQMINDKSGAKLDLASRQSTDLEGIEKCLGLQSEAKLDMQVIVDSLQRKLSSNTLMSIASPPPSARPPQD